MRGCSSMAPTRARRIRTSRCTCVRAPTPSRLKKRAAPATQRRSTWSPARRCTCNPSCETRRRTVPVVREYTDGMADGMNERFDNLERLMVDIKESLETEMQSGFSSVNTKLDDMSTRLDRQAGLLRTGGQRIARLDDWAEKVDKSLEAKDRDIAELRERRSEERTSELQSLRHL